jgi:dGTPase
MNNNNFSCFAADSKFAKRVSSPSEKEHTYRDPFERDRDRIIYSMEFRRLHGKTQVFVSGYDDSMRNRQTHTIEVAQIAITIAKQLGLNIPLVEAIADGHDVGHTPFGHAGEQVLNHIMNGCLSINDFNMGLENKHKGFKHNWQGIRVAMHLERYSHDYAGLNLTDFTLWGILNHTGKQWKVCNLKGKPQDNKKLCGLLHGLNPCNTNTFSLGFYEQYGNKIIDTAFTIEALVVGWADEIAQRHHDLEDGLISGIVDKRESLKNIKTFFSKYMSKEETLRTEELITNLDSESAKYEGFFVADISQLVINFLITNLIQDTKKNLLKLKRDYAIDSQEKFHAVKSKMVNEIDIYSNTVNYKPGLLTAHNGFKKFLKRRILGSYVAQSMDGKSSYILKRLFEAYATNPQQLPDRTIRYLFSNYYTNLKKDNKSKNVFRYHSIGYWREKLETIHYTEDSPEYKAAVLRTICDFISGMTDSFAYQQYDMLYGSQRIRKPH